MQCITKLISVTLLLDPSFGLALHVTVQTVTELANATHHASLISI